MTREKWDELWWELYHALVKVGNPPDKAFKEAHRRMQRTHGPRPESELSGPGLLDLINLGLIARKVLKMTKPSVTAIVAAIGAAASAFGAAYSIATGDGVITTVEWVSIVWATASALIAGLFQSPTKPPQA